MNFTILRFETIGSTNDEALRQAKLGVNEGLCIVAKQQTSGRGRHGRVWFSPIDAGLYASFVLRPTIEMRFLPMITLLAGIVVHDTLEEVFKLDCDIKWANDILVNHKKICGILAETCETPQGLAVVLGIGINLKSSNFPQELAEIATSIESETNHTPKPEILLENLTRSLAFYYEKFLGESGAEFTKNEWSARSTFAFGKEVRVALEKEILIGTTRGLTSDGALMIEDEHGETKTIRAGDVTQIREAEN